MGQSIGTILQQWEQLGIFYYALPFLLIFALVFAVLQKVKLMGGDDDRARGVNAIIALAVALMALQYNKVPIFFQVIFPKLGIAISILLVAIILVGLFVDFSKHEGAAVIFFGIGGVSFIVILLSSFEDYSWWSGGWWYNNMSAIIAGIILLVFVMVIINSGKVREKGTPNWLFKPISGGH